VVVLNRMGVLAEPELMDGTVALLDAGCLGQEQGPAVARILFGRAEPGGRLAHTVPGSVGELPCHYSHPGAARRGYGFVANRPLFPFGFGLSYTRFALLSASLERDTLRPGETARVRVRLRNEGNRRGSEVVQVYHRDLVASRTRNTRELAAFAKLHLEPGAEEEVVLAIPPDVLGFYNEENHFVQEPGRHRLWITTGADPLGGRVLELNVIQASGLQT